jgi:hypothetical protein
LDLTNRGTLSARVDGDAEFQLYDNIWNIEEGKSEEEKVSRSDGLLAPNVFFRDGGEEVHFRIGFDELPVKD